MRRNVHCAGKALCSMRPTRDTRAGVKALLFALLCAASAATRAEEVNAGSDWLVFLSAEIKRPYGIDAARLSDPQGEFAAQIVFNHFYGAARVLVEGELSNDDAGIDRFQVGWQVGEDNTLWLGKFHQDRKSVV